jgi:hypothetical protein
VGIDASEAKIVKGRGSHRGEDAARGGGRVGGSDPHLVEQALELGFSHEIS